VLDLLKDVGVSEENNTAEADHTGREGESKTESYEDVNLVDSYELDSEEKFRSKRQGWSKA